VIGREFAEITMRKNMSSIIHHTLAIVPHVVTRNAAAIVSARAAALKLR